MHTMCILLNAISKANTIANGQTLGTKKSKTVIMVSVLAIWSEGNDVSAYSFPIGEGDIGMCYIRPFSKPIISTNTFLSHRSETTKTNNPDKIKTCENEFRLVLYINRRTTIIMDHNPSRNGLRLMNCDNYQQWFHVIIVEDIELSDFHIWVIKFIKSINVSQAVSFAWWWVFCHHFKFVWSIFSEIDGVAYLHIHRSSGHCRDFSFAYGDDFPLLGFSFGFGRNDASSGFDFFFNRLDKNVVF